MKKFYPLVFLFCFFLSFTASAQVVLSGKINDQNGQPLPGASIQLVGSNRGVVAGKDGRYSLSFPSSGEFNLKVSFIGYKTVQEKLLVSNALTKNFQLTESESELQSVEIVGRKEDGYKNSNTFLGSKTQTPIKDLPQSVSYVTKELISDQGLMRTGETVKNMSGVNQFTFYDDITIRGFRINGSSSTQLVNGMRTTTGFWKQPLINFLERV